MKIIPERIDRLGPERRASIMRRSMEELTSIYEDMKGIVDDVRKRGDAALLDSCLEYKDKVKPDEMVVTDEEIIMAYDRVNTEVVEALKKAADNIRRFHEAQLERDMWSMELCPGVLAGRITRPLDRVGCYIPGGRAVYPSTILMTILPALAAGVKEIFATTPPRKGMIVPPATLVAADIAGCHRLYKVGGPWGIAALAYGTDTVQKVDKIVGPGNKYVTAAKMIVYGEVDIDSPAGPSEALILCDQTGDPRLIAFDFLSQTEHDPDSAAVIVTTDENIAEKVCRIIEEEFDTLPRKEIIESAVRGHSAVLIAQDLDEAIRFTNEYAPEHLEIITEDPFITLNRIRHAGSIFMGRYAPVAVGDYASGTNHVLPTGQCARMFSGLSVDDFLKKPTFQYLSREGLDSLKDTVVTLAEAEGLPMHARAVKERFRHG